MAGATALIPEGSQPRALIIRRIEPATLGVEFAAE